MGFNFSLKLLKFWLYGWVDIIGAQKSRAAITTLFCLASKAFCLEAFEPGTAFCWLCWPVLHFLDYDSCFPCPYILSMSLREYITFILFDYVFCLLRLPYDYWYIWESYLISTSNLFHPAFFKPFFFFFFHSTL